MYPFSSSLFITMAENCSPTLKTLSGEGIGLRENSEKIINPSLLYSRRDTRTPIFNISFTYKMEETFFLFTGDVQIKSVFSDDSFVLWTASSTATARLKRYTVCGLH